MEGSGPRPFGRAPHFYHPGHCYQHQPSGFSGTYGKMAATNPGTREVFVIATRHFPTMPVNIAGGFLGTGTPAGTDVKIRQALFSSNGPYWGGATDVDTGLPWNLLAQQTAGVLISATRTAYLGSTSARGLRCSLATPVYVMPQPIWIVTAYESLYTADTDQTALGNMSEIIGWPTQAGGASGAFHRNVYLSVVKTDIEALDLFTSLAQLAASNWVQASAAGSVSVSCNAGAKVLAASFLPSAAWQLIIV